MQSSTTVPIKGDMRYKNAIRALANQRNVEIGEIIRHAVDTVYGDALEPYLVFFAAQAVHEIGQVDNPQSNEKHTTETRGKRPAKVTIHE